MPILDAQNISKSYGTRKILDGVDLTIRTGERVGVVGLNGAGKSTLGRILAGLEEPDSGSVAQRRGSSIRYLAQVPEFEGAPSVEQAVVQGLGDWSEAAQRHAAISRQLEAHGAAQELLEQQARAAEDVERLGGWDQQHRARALLERLGIDRPQANVASLSGGEQRRVALAQVLVAAPSLAVLDEPTNHLDAETIDWLERYLTSDFPGGLLLITHDRYLLNRVVTRTLEVSDGHVFSYDGGYERYLEQKAERVALAQRTEQNRQNFLRGELEWLRRQPKARGTKQKARIERAEQAIEQRAPKAERSFSFEVGVARQGKTLLELANLTLSIQERTLVDDLSLIVAQGDRIGIIGRNGTGKSTLLRAITGQLLPTGGRVELGATTRIAYFDQERSGLDLEQTVFDNVIGDQPQIELGGRSIEPYSYLERFGFGSQEHRQPVASLSGGERARVALARLLRQEANLIILDEPTNDLDVASLSALENMLIEFSITALVVTHDRWFLDRVANCLLAFEGEGQVTRYAGNYQALQHARQEAQKQRDVAPSAAPPKPKQRKKALTWAEQRELEGLLERIEAAEARVEQLGNLLSHPDTYQKSETGIATLTADLDAARVEVETLTTRWEELETKKADLER